MKRILIVAALVACALAVGASSVWEGSAVQGGAGDFPAEGLYGSCNSFPKNSRVEVENLGNGKKAVVTITGTVGNPGVFMALSPSAARELGMKAGDAARVRVLAEPAASVPAPALPARPGESSDPDFNPKLLALRERSAPASSSAKTAAPVQPAAPAAAAPASAAPADVALLLKPAEPPLPEKAETASVVEPTTQKAPAAKAIAPEVPEPALAKAEPAAPAAAPVVPQATVAAAPAAEAKAPLEPAPALPVATPPSAAPTARAEPSVLPEAIVRVDARPETAASPELALPDPEERGAAALVGAPEEGPAVLGLEAAALPPGDGALAALDEPELRPDELPEESLARLENPPASPLDFALAEGEIDMAEREKAEALALEKPAALESSLQAELAEAEVPSEAEAEPLDVAEASEEALGPLPAGEASEVALAEPEPSAEDEAEVEVVAAAPTAPAAEPEAEVDLALSLEPTASRPPVQPAAPAPVATVPAKPAPAAASVPSGPLTPPAGLPLIARLAKGSFYIQIGVYGTNEALHAAVKGFKGGYPLALEEAASGGARYRLYVGPLSRDEGGVVLSRVKAMGFKDAFIKQGT